MQPCSPNSMKHNLQLRYCISDARLLNTQKLRCSFDGVPCILNLSQLLWSTFVDVNLTWNISLTFCLGRFTLSLWSSWWTSPMLRVPSPFLSASEKVCCNHVRLQLRRKLQHDQVSSHVLFCQSITASNSSVQSEFIITFRWNNQLKIKWCVHEWLNKGYWSRVRCLRARLSSSLIPAMRYFSPVIQVRASSALVETRFRDFTRSP